MFISGQLSQMVSGMENRVGTGCKLGAVTPMHQEDINSIHSSHSPPVSTPCSLGYVKWPGNKSPCLGTERKILT